MAHINLRSLLVIAFCLIGFQLIGVSSAHAQTALKWNERQLTWTAPQACVDGSPISECPVTGYRVETASACNAPTWTLIGSTDAVTVSFKASSLPAGTNCFRVKAKSAAGDGPPTNTVSVTVTGPTPGQPGTLTVSSPTAYEYKSATDTMARVAFVPVGTPCGPQTKVISGITYCRLDINEADFVNWPSDQKLTEVWATAG